MKNGSSDIEKQHESGEQETSSESASTTPVIISRKEALAKGLTKYYTGQPCKRGHVVFRWVADFACSECAKVNKQKNSKKSMARRLKLLHSAKYRCAKRGITFDITVDNIHIPEYCPVMGIKIEPGGSGFSDNSPSIDRKDPSKGYTPDNIHVICWRANKLKSDATIEEIRAVLKYMEGTQE